MLINKDHGLQLALLYEKKFTYTDHIGCAHVAYQVAYIYVFLYICLCTNHTPDDNPFMLVPLWEEVECLQIFQRIHRRQVIGMHSAGPAWGCIYIYHKGVKLVLIN